MKTDKTQENQVVSESESPIKLSMELPEVSEVSTEYHDDEFLANSEKPEENQGVTDNNENKSDTVIGEKNSGSSDSTIVLDEEREKVRGIKDDKGKAYDPALHVFPPEKTPSGIWKKLPKSQRGVNKEGKETLPTKTNASVRKSAEKFAQLYDSAHILFFGEDGKADTKQISKLSDSFERYFQEAGSIDLPPHLDVLFTCVTHSTEICKRPTVTERIKGKLAVWAVKKQLKKAFKNEQISEGQFAEAKAHLSQGVEHFNRWQNSLRNINGEKTDA